MNLLQAWSSMFVARTLMFAQGLKPSEMPVQLFEFFPPALSHVISSPVGYLAMRYIPYPLYILVSSCKLIPVMIVGMLLNGNIPSFYDLGSATIMTVGIIFYSFTQIFGNGSAATDTAQHDIPTLFGYSLNETHALIVGILFTLTNLTLEGYTNASQDRIFNKVAGNKISKINAIDSNVQSKDDTVITTTIIKNNPSSLSSPSAPSLPPPSSVSGLASPPSSSSKPQRIPSLWMQAAMNTLTSSTLAIGMGIEYLLTSQKENTYIGYTLSFVQRHPELLTHVLSFALLGSFAQIFIYTTIENYGSFTTTTITISRKFVSVLLSVVIFHHVLQWNQWFGVLCVFSGLGLQLSFGGKKRGTTSTHQEHHQYKVHTTNLHHPPIDNSHHDPSTVSANENDTIDITRTSMDDFLNPNRTVGTVRKRREDFTIHDNNKVYGATVPLSPAKDERPNVWEEPKKDV